MATTDAGVNGNISYLMAYQPICLASRSQDTEKSAKEFQIYLENFRNYRPPSPQLSNSTTTTSEDTNNLPNLCQQSNESTTIKKHKRSESCDLSVSVSPFDVSYPLPSSPVPVPSPFSKSFWEWEPTEGDEKDKDNGSNNNASLDMLDELDLESGPEAGPEGEAGPFALDNKENVQPKRRKLSTIHRDYHFLFDDDVDEFDYPKVIL
jgi:hypothetical protein